MLDEVPRLLTTLWRRRVANLALAAECALDVGALKIQQTDCGSDTS
ncbi:Uncharacterised protein [Vibrio cholerae]|nr:Uncharacterised protein [Vibrio cholerae]